MQEQERARLGSRPLTWPVVNGLAHGGWTDALPRPAPSAGVPLVGSIEHMFLLCQGFGDFGNGSDFRHWGMDLQP